MLHLLLNIDDNISEEELMEVIEAHVEGIDLTKSFEYSYRRFNTCEKKVKRNLEKELLHQEKIMCDNFGFFRRIRNVTRYYLHISVVSERKDHDDIIRKDCLGTIRTSVSLQDELLERKAEGEDFDLSIIFDRYICKEFSIAEKWIISSLNRIIGIALQKNYLEGCTRIFTPLILTRIPCESDSLFKGNRCDFLYRRDKIKSLLPIKEASVLAKIEEERPLRNILMFKHSIWTDNIH